MLDQYPAEMRPFIEAILASPQDDAPVLIFADWLEENGWTEFASVIRLEPWICRETIKDVSIFFWIDPGSHMIKGRFPPQVPAVGV